MSTLIERQLRASVAIPLLTASVTEMLEYMRKRYDSMNHTATFLQVEGEPDLAAGATKEADALFEKIMRAEIALKTVAGEA